MYGQAAFIAGLFIGIIVGMLMLIVFLIGGKL